MARKRYDVVPAGTIWVLKHLGSMLSSQTLKSTAVEDERTYGNDPFPPRG